MPSAMAMDLPDDCWELIFSYLDSHFDEHLPITFVSKRFLTISNRSRTFLPFPYARPVPPTIPPALYARFPNLTHIILNHPDPQIDGFIRQLAASSLRLQSLCFCSQSYFPGDAMRILAESKKETLKVLSCSDIVRITEADVLLIADSFSYLHDLALMNFGGQQTKSFITDEAVHAISTKMVSLSSLTISPANDYFSCASFNYLASHCNSLSKLNISFDKKSPFELYWFSSFKSLKTLYLRFVRISDSGLIHLSQVGNLKSLLNLEFDFPIMSMVNGLAMCQFLKSCQSLTDLKFNKFQFSPSTIGIDIADSIAKSIQVISIYHCVNLPTTMFYNLFKTCPSLRDVTLFNSETVIDEDSFDLPVNYGMQSLTLSSNTLSDKTLMRICCSCPRLDSFTIHRNSRITTQGAKAIFRGGHCNFNCLEISRLRDGLKDFNLYKDNSPYPHKLWCDVMDNEQDRYGEEHMKDFGIADELDRDDYDTEDSDKDDDDVSLAEANDEGTGEDGCNDNEGGSEKGNGYRNDEDEEDEKEERNQCNEDDGHKDI